MNPHIEQKPDASSGAEGERSDARARALARRRRFLTGGLSAVPAIVTLANKPALAKNFCTVSAKMSGNASRPMRGPCGSSPGCWKNHALKNNASSWTSTGLSPHGLLTSLFPMFKTHPWKCFPSDATLLQALEMSCVIRAKVDGSWVDPKFPKAFTAQIVAGVLNARFFGTFYPIGEDAIKQSVLNALTSYGSKLDSDDLKKIKNKISSLTDTLAGYNNVNDECIVL
jgi:hypothetical protein